MERSHDAGSVGVMLLGFSLLVAGSILSSSSAWSACGCNSMTIDHAANSNVTLCSSNQLNFPECTRKPGGTTCPATTYSYTCPVGANSLNAARLEQQVGFAANATVSGTSSDCQSGQALQLTITSNQSFVKPTVHSTPSGDVNIGAFSARIVNSPPTAVYPNVGSFTQPPNPMQSYGADSYTDPLAPALLIERTSNAIRWWDNTDQSKDNAAENATWFYRFVSYVRGTAGQKSCACVFDVNVDWIGPTPTTTMTGVNALSTACTF